MNTALLIIDIQNDYFPGGAMELFGADAAAERAASVLAAFRAKGLPVVHVQFGLACDAAFPFTP